MEDFLCPSAPVELQKAPLAFCRLLLNGFFRSVDLDRHHEKSEHKMFEQLKRHKL